VIDGKVLQGAHGLATHVGFLSSGLQGTALELHASGGALGRQASQQLGREVDARTVVLLAEEGDEGMLDLVQAAVRELAIMLRRVQWVLDPQCIAIGGGVGLAPLVFAALEREASRDEALGVRAPMHLVRAELGANAGLVGMGAWLDEHANP